MPEIIPEDIQEPTPVEQIIANDLTGRINPELSRRLAFFKNSWDTTWENPRSTPDAVVEAMGTKAARFFLAGSIERDYFQSIATALGVTFAELVGDDKYLTTKYPVTVNENGTATVEMPE